MDPQIIAVLNLICVLACLVCLVFSVLLYKLLNHDKPILMLVLTFVWGLGIRVAITENVPANITQPYGVVFWIFITYALYLLYKSVKIACSSKNKDKEKEIKK